MNRSQEVFQRQYDTNVFGTIKVTRSILPFFRRRRAGTIVMMSSAAGNLGMPGASPYVSSKFALEGTQGLLCRMASMRLDKADTLTAQAYPNASASKPPT